MTLQARPRVQRRAPTAFQTAVTRLLLVALMVVFTPTTASAGQSGITVELNAARTQGEVCIGSFLLKNGLGRTLDRFQLDLFVFGDDGVIKLRSNIDLAPLRHDKSTVISFRILPEPCTSVSRVLINDIPLCRAENGAKLDCLEGLTVSSRGRVELAK